MTASTYRTGLLAAAAMLAAPALSAQEWDQAPPADESEILVQGQLPADISGLPKGLAEVGVTPAMFDKIIDGAMADHCHKTNPRLASREDYREMLEGAM